MRRQKLTRSLCKYCLFSQVSKSPHPLPPFTTATHGVVPYRTFWLSPIHSFPTLFILAFHFVCCKLRYLWKVSKSAFLQADPLKYENPPNRYGFKPVFGSRQARKLLCWIYSGSRSRSNLMNPSSSGSSLESNSKADEEYRYLYYGKCS